MESLLDIEYSIMDVGYFSPVFIKNTCIYFSERP